MIIGKETCPTTQRDHLQGYVEFFIKQSIKSAKSILKDPQLHLEKRQGTREQARDYCMKDGNFTEYGDWETEQGKRMDLIKLQQQIEEGKDDYEIGKEDPVAYNDYHRFIDRWRLAVQKWKSKGLLQQQFENTVLNDHQQIILNHLKNQNDRQITWIYDHKGGKGKTYLSKYLMAKENAFRCSNGKTKDIAYAYNGEKIFIMDLCRSNESGVNYQIIEEVKNGVIFSSKYNSQCKVFETPQVLILANFLPDKSKLSEDRWDIVNLDDDHNDLKEVDQEINDQKMYRDLPSNFKAYDDVPDSAWNFE